MPTNSDSGYASSVSNFEELLTAPRPEQYGFFASSTCILPSGSYFFGS